MSVSDHVCPACWRYGSDDMRSIYTEGGKLSRLLSVEAALAQAQAELGIIPEYAAEEITKKATADYVTPEDVWEEEQKIRHDVMAMVHKLSDACEGDAGGYVHLDATSYDIQDNALSLQMRDASGIIIDKTAKFGRALMDRAEEYKSLPAIGRTHGQHAEPITFGFKFAKYLSDVISDYDDWMLFTDKYLVGKPMTGAVGTSDSYVLSGGKDSARKIGAGVMKRLGLNPALITDQVISRKMHSKVANLLAQSASTSEKFAWEVWNLQRPELGEVWEKSYSSSQVGSSTMPHKRNPINSENIISLARVVKGFAGISKENIALLHERDLTNSAAERVIIPQSYLYTDEILKRSERVAREMVVREDNVRDKLNMFKEFTATEPIMLALAGRGVGRQKAHDLLRQYTQRLYDEPGAEPIEVLRGIDEISDNLTESELKDLMNPANYTGLSREYTEDVIKKARETFPA